MVLTALGRYVEARGVLNRSADIRELAASRLHLGTVCEKLNLKQEALREYRRGWEKVKDDPTDRDYAALRQALARFGEEPAERKEQ